MYRKFFKRLIDVTASAAVLILASPVLAAVAVLLFQLSLPYAMLMVAIGDVLKVIWCYRRFYGKKWMRIMT